MSNQQRLVRALSADAPDALISVNGEDVVFHEIVTLTPTTLEKKEPSRGAPGSEQSTPS